MTGASRPLVFYSTVGGTTVGWDVCGGCHRHISRCSCDDGPVEPAYLAAERTPDDPPFHPSALSGAA